MNAPNKLGFSLVEVLVVLVIVALLIALALPSVNAMHEKNNIKHAQQQLALSLRLARSSAKQTNTAITICPLANAAVPICSNGNDWSNGWMLLNTQSAQIYQLQAPITGVKIIGHKSKLIYLPTGLLFAGNQTFVIKSAKQQHGFYTCLVISRTAKMQYLNGGEAHCSA